MISDFASLAEHARVADFTRGDARSVHARLVAGAVRVAATADCGRGRGRGGEEMGGKGRREDNRRWVWEDKRSRKGGLEERDISFNNFSFFFLSFCTMTVP